MLRTAPLGILLAAVAGAQDLRLDWRQIGNSAIRHSASDVATGPVERVWFTASATIAARIASGEVWETGEDDSSWKHSESEPPDRPQRELAGRIYRAGSDAFRSDDGGRTWRNLTHYRGSSILGGPIFDVAVSPMNPEDIVASGATGVWRSRDGGETWASLNQGLPNLGVRRILALPSGGQGLRVTTRDAVLEWLPGQKLAWTWVAGDEPGSTTEVMVRGGVAYVGFENGAIAVTRDGIVRPPFNAGGPVRRFWVDTRDPLIALAVAGKRVYRTLNGGLFWDDVTGVLPEGELHGIAADRDSGAVYAAGEHGVFYATTDFNVLTAGFTWQRLTGSLPAGHATDVRLDAAANQLFVAIDGYGVFAALAPHRLRRPLLVSSADLAARPAAPGALLSLFGPALTRAQSGGRVIPLLAASDGESQMQVPFDVQGTELALRLDSAARRWDMSLPLEAAAPAIFIDRDGSPMVLDGDSGVLLDAMNPARSGARLQILATGLGRVRPDWRAGVEAPVENPPAVVANVRVLLDGQPLEVTRATLAPGYVGFYLVEALMPGLVNSGSAELHIETAGRPSNPVRVYIEP